MIPPEDPKSQPRIDPLLVRGRPYDASIPDLGPVRDLVQARVPADLALALRVEAARRRRQIQDIVAEAISEWLERHGS